MGEQLLSLCNVNSCFLQLDPPSGGELGGGGDNHIPPQGNDTTYQGYHTD